MLRLVAYLITVVAASAGLVGLSYLLGEKRKDRQLPYESGMPPTGTARGRLDVQFYLMAVLFVIFDVEVAFFLVWAVAGRQLGWSAFGEIVVFATVLLVALAYLWRAGALDWPGRVTAVPRQRDDVA